MLERDPVKKLHDQIRAPIFFADVVNRADVGMVQRRGSLRLPPESFQRHAILRQLFGKKLQCDKAAKARVFGFVNDAHAAAAKLLNDPVMREGLIEQGGPA